MNRIIPLFFALSLGGCSTVTALLGGSSVASQAGTVSVKTEQGLTIAHLAYQAIGEQLIAAARNGTIKGANATAAKSWYDKAGDALNVADAADKAANDSGVISAVSDATAAITQAKTLVGN